LVPSPVLLAAHGLHLGVVLVDGERHAVVLVPPPEGAEELVIPLGERDRETGKETGGDREGDREGKSEREREESIVGLEEVPPTHDTHEHSLLNSCSSPLSFSPATSLPLLSSSLLFDVRESVSLGHLRVHHLGVALTEARPHGL
jgi:hypothetical protein